MAILVKSAAALDQIKQQVVDGWREMCDERDEAEETWRRCLMAYLNYFDKKWVEYATQANRSHRFVALSWDAVETVLPQIYNAALMQDNAHRVRPIRQGGDSEEDDMWAEAMTHYIRYQMRMSGYKAIARTAIKSMLITGNCPWTCDWHVKRAPDYGQFADAMKRWLEESRQYHAEYQDMMAEYQQLSLRSELMGQPLPPPPEFENPPPPPRDLDIVYEGPRLRIGSIFNYVEEQHPNEQDQALRIMRTFRTKAYLKQMAQPDDTGYRLYDRLQYVKDLVAPDTARDNEHETLIKLALGMEVPNNKTKVELKEMHGTFEIMTGQEKGIYENYIVTVANDSEVIRCEPSPLASGRPMIHNAKLITLEGAVYGIGIIEKALDEQDSANAIHNQTIDAVNSVIAPELEVVLDNLVDAVMKPSGPGVRHEVNESGSINPIRKSFEGIPTGFNAVQAAIARHERITGAINTAPQGEETATRTARNTNIIATKLGGHVVSVEDNLLTPSLDMFLEMNAQYIDEDQVIQVTQDGRNIKQPLPLNAIRRGWFIYVAGSKYLADREERINSLLMATQMVAQVKATGQPVPVKEEELWRRLFKEILEDAEDIVMSKEEFQQYMAQIQQQQMLAMLMQEGGGMNGPAQGRPAGRSGTAPSGAGAGIA